LTGGISIVISSHEKFAIARPTPDWSLDAGFNHTVYSSATVNAIALHNDGKILVGGHNIWNGTGLEFRYLGRLNPNGSSDLAFRADINAEVKCIEVLPDGKFLAGGVFSSAGTRGSTSRSREGLARFNIDGSLDLDFNDPKADFVYDIAMDGNGKILIGGWIDDVQGVPRSNVVRLDTDGILDNSYNPQFGPDGYTYAISPLPDGKVWMGGDGFMIVGSQRHVGLVRLNAAGVGQPFAKDVSPDRVVSKIVLQPDGKILMAGAFAFAGQQKHLQIARINPDSSHDDTFVDSTMVTASPTLGRILGIAVQPADLKILVAGDIRSVNGITRTGLARFNPNGTLDESFNPTITGPGDLYAVAVQSDGKILFGGHYDTVNGVAKYGMTRLHPNGSLDLSFNFTTISQMSAIVPLANGQILAGGSGGMYRVNENGSLDLTFQNTVNSVRKIVPLEGGRIIVSGGF